MNKLQIKLVLFSCLFAFSCAASSAYAWLRPTTGIEWTFINKSKKPIDVAINHSQELGVYNKHIYKYEIKPGQQKQIRIEYPTYGTAEDSHVGAELKQRYGKDCKVEVKANTVWFFGPRLNNLNGGVVKGQHCKLEVNENEPSVVVTYLSK